jgi:cell wall-associated NlpC family hydrolase
MSDSKPHRRDLLLIADSLVGVPYVFGAKGSQQVFQGRIEPTPQLCFDCSGLVCWCLWKAGGPDLRMEWSADRLFKELPPVQLPEPGDLAFYGARDSADHVMMVVNGRVIGASGGTKQTTTAMLGVAMKAMVKYKDQANYRADFLGYRSIAQFVDH